MGQCAAFTAEAAKSIGSANIGDFQRTASKDNVSKRALVQDKQPSSEGGDGATVSRSPNPLPANRRWIVVAVAVILGISGLAAGYAWHRHAESLIDANNLVLQGNIDVRQVNLAFKVDGRIETLMVDEGDTVKRRRLAQSVLLFQHIDFSAYRSPVVRSWGASVDVERVVARLVAVDVFCHTLLG